MGRRAEDPAERKAGGQPLAFALRLRSVKHWASESCNWADFNLTAALRRRDSPSRTDARPGLPEVARVRRS